MYLIFYFDKILCRLPFPTLDAWSLAYTIRESVPLPHYLEFGIRDKEIRERRAREQRGRALVYYFEKHTKKSPGNIQLPGPPIRIKGLPRYLDWSITHLTFYHPKLTYQGMLSIHHTFNFIYININIIPTLIVNPYTMQITLHIKVFFKS